MTTKNQYRLNNTMGVLTGMLIGGLAGAVTMFLLAPQSGQKTRKLIQEKSIELVDETTEMLDRAMTKVLHDGKKLTSDGTKKAMELIHDGKALVDEQLEHVSDAAKAGKKAYQS